MRDDNGGQEAARKKPRTEAEAKQPAADQALCIRVEVEGAPCGDAYQLRLQPADEQPYRYNAERDDLLSEWSVWVSATCSFTLHRPEARQGSVSSEHRVAWCKDCYLGTDIIPVAQLPMFVKQEQWGDDWQRSLTVSIELQVPVPTRSRLGSGDVVLTSDDGFAFRAHSQRLQRCSGVLAGLLEEHADSLQQGPPLSIPWKGSGEQLHLALQVMYHSQLVQYWTLEALQAVAAAAHRLAFTEYTLPSIERAIIRATAGLTLCQKADLLSWAVEVDCTEVQKELVRHLALGGWNINLGSWFPDKRQVLVVQAMQAHIDELAKQADKLKKLAGPNWAYHLRYTE